MTKWRPQEWRPTYYDSYSRWLKNDFGDECQTFEAGADAMLEALRDKAEAATKDGLWVFIPDDTKEINS